MGSGGTKLDALISILRDQKDFNAKIQRWQCIEFFHKNYRDIRGRAWERCGIFNGGVLENFTMTIMVKIWVFTDICIQLLFKHVSFLILLEALVPKQYLVSYIMQKEV